MSQDDQVEVVIIKAKPKYPHQIFQEDHPVAKARQFLSQASEPVIQKGSQQPLPVDYEEEVRERRV